MRMLRLGCSLSGFRHRGRRRDVDGRRKIWAGTKGTGKERAEQQTDGYTSYWDNVGLSLTSYLHSNDSHDFRMICKLKVADNKLSNKKFFAEAVSDGLLAGIYIPGQAALHSVDTLTSSESSSSDTFARQDTHSMMWGHGNSADKHGRQPVCRRSLAAGLSIISFNCLLSPPRNQRCPLAALCKTHSFSSFSSSPLSRSAIFLLHIALEIPVAVQGVWSPSALPFLQLNNTTLVIIKVGLFQPPSLNF